VEKFPTGNLHPMSDGGGPGNLRPDPRDLITTPNEALLVLTGDGLFVVGGLLFLAGALGDWMPVAVVGMIAGMTGVALTNILGSRVARRLRPGVRWFTRWHFESMLGQQWLRPSVMRRAVAALRDRDGS
jgi:hypothetical protein